MTNDDQAETAYIRELVKFVLERDFDLSWSGSRRQDPSCSIGGVKMADQGAADPGNNNNNKPEASEGTIIKVTVKTPKDKEEIAIAEDASVTQVGWVLLVGS